MSRYAFLDLEFNQIQQHQKRKIEHQAGINIANFDILQVGVIVCNDYLSELKRFDEYILPRYNTDVNESVKRITGITESKLVKNGSTLKHVMHKLDVFLDMYSLEIITWGHDDALVINQNIRCYNIKSKCFKDPVWVDLQRVYMNMYELEKQPSLYSVCNKLGIEIDYDKEHTALYDAELTMRVAKFIGLDKIREYNYAREKIERPKLFKGNVWNEDEYGIRMFHCECCRTPARKILASEILIKNGVLTKKYLVFCKKCKFIYEYEVSVVNGVKSCKLTKRYWFREFKENEDYFRREFKVDINIETLVKKIKKQTA